MKKIVLAALLSCMATPAVAQPVYLECQVNVPGTPGKAGNVQKFEITINEAESTASMKNTVTGWSMANEPATFTPDSVTWKTPWLSRWWHKNTVSRTTLQFYSEDSGTDDDDWWGTCSIVKANPEAKF